MYNLVKFLHIILAFLAVAVSVGPELLLHRIIQTGSVPAIRTAFGLMRPLGIAIPVLYLLSVIFGFITALQGGYPLGTTWLVIAYVLYIIASILGGAIVGPWTASVGKAAAASPDEAPSEELRTLLHSPRANLAMWGNFVVLLLLVADMVFKPAW
jgi:uncharacterized membrane protein